MSTVHVHVGQCGNQIGKEFWLKASHAASLDENIKRAFVTPGGLGEDHGHVRAVFLDSEKKVLQNILKLGRVNKKGHSRLRLGRGNVISSAKGCGSNWSMGHHYLPEERVSKDWDRNLYSYSYDFDYGKEDSMLKTAMETIRREVESCDSFSGFISWHSLAGGTGSGFGPRLCAELRERYPVAYQMNVVVSPLTSGENPMQAYNELFSLASLQRDSDAIVLFENDEIIDVIEAAKSTSSNAVSFEEMNSYIADCVLNAVSPVSSLTPPSGLTVGIEPWELIRSATPMHNLKFLHCRTVAQAKSTRATPTLPDTWDSICNKACHQIRSKFLKAKSTNNCDDSTLAAVCVCRDTESLKKTSKQPNQVDVAKIASKMKNALNCMKWNPFPIDMWVDEQKLVTGLGKEDVKKSITTCSNLTSFGTVHCANLLRSAKRKFDAKAYLHWYERYGTSDGDFTEAFEVVQNIVEEYKMAGT